MPPVKQAPSEGLRSGRAVDMERADSSASRFTDEMIMQLTGCVGWQFSAVQVAMVSPRLRNREMIPRPGSLPPEGGRDTNVCGRFAR
jgi:hypothetical protein